MISLLWGATFPLVKGATAAVSTPVFLVLRFVIALLVLLPVALLTKHSLRSILAWTSAVPGSLLAMGFVLQTEGLRTTSPSISAFLTGLSVILVPILGRVLGWNRVTLRFWIQALIALAGLILLQGGRPPAEWHRGETLTIACAVAFAGQILVVERLLPRHPSPIPFTTGQILWATVLLVAWALATGKAPIPGPLPPYTWFGVLYTGSIATAAAFLVQTWAQKRLTSSAVAICYSTEPVFAALLSVGFFGDRIRGSGLAGILLIFGALVLTALAPSPQTGSVEPNRRRC
jgi:drug/metabolite transporter (DMT)-like permease